MPFSIQEFYARFSAPSSRGSAKGRAGEPCPFPTCEAPHQLRHVLPILLHERLARVRAYDTVLPASDDAILHALRVEFKQLRYALEFFQPLLGNSNQSFLREAKEMQDILGRINDIAVFSDYMSGLKKLTPVPRRRSSRELPGRSRPGPGRPAPALRGTVGFL